MRLKIGDKIYCYKLVGSDGLTIGEEYIVTNTRSKSRWCGDDICILDDGGSNWWFGQVGETESWTNWFVPELEWKRDKLIDEILNND